MVERDLKANKNETADNLNSTTSTSKSIVIDLPTDGWRVFPSQNIPSNFNYGHVYFYLVESVSSASNIEDSESDDGDNLYDTCDTVTAKPLKKGRNLLKSGFIENIHDNFNEPKQEYLLRAHVQHSMKNMLPLNVCIVVSAASGNVKIGLCDCKASALGRCAHIAALLLKLSDVASDTYMIVEPSTSQPCTWNKGKKREKKPKKLHQAEYNSSKRKPPSELYMWDPRPESQRPVTEDSIRKFVVDLQSDQKPSMWESLLQINYEDWKLEASDNILYRDLSLQFVEDFEKHNHVILKSNICCQIPDTQNQAESDRWHSERRFRITASKCQSAVNLGENLSKYDSLRPHFNWLKKNLWFPEYFCNRYMQYGIDNEEIALKEYSNRMNVLVGFSGLWFLPHA